MTTFATQEYLKTIFESGLRQIQKVLYENETWRYIVLGTPICVVLHWFVIHLYVYLCVQTGIVGLLKSYYLLLTPQCILLDKVTRYTYDFYINIWWYILGSVFALGSFVVQKVVR